jgi:N-acetylglucosamine-6-phosphate deacetylase
MEAFHVEGPHISPDDGPRGAHPRQWVRPPDFEEYLRWQDATEGLIRLVTLSPEWPEAPRYIERLARHGVVVSIGHTKATAEQIADAVSAGATMSTHIGNGAHGEMRRHPNYLWDQLAEDRLTAGLIVDGIHIGQAFLKVALRAKTVARAFLVTDASMPAMAAPGIYRLGIRMWSIRRWSCCACRTDKVGGVGFANGSRASQRDAHDWDHLSGGDRDGDSEPSSGWQDRWEAAGACSRGRADLVVFRYDASTRQVEVLKTIAGGTEVFTASGS